MARHTRLRRRVTLASRFMDSVGDGSGSVDMNVNGSVTPQMFFIYPRPGHMIFMSRMEPHFTDQGTIDSGGFGNGAALTNGLMFGDYNMVTNTFNPATAQKPIKKNVDFSAYSYDVTVNAWGTGDQSLTNRYTFNEDGSHWNIPDGWAFAAMVQDDLTVLNEFVLHIGCTEVKL